MFRKQYATFFTQGCAILMASAAVAFAAAPSPAPVPATAPASQEGWTEFPLGKTGDITIAVRMRKETSIAQYRWMELVITNPGGPARVQPPVAYLRNVEIIEAGKGPKPPVDLGTLIPAGQPTLTITTLPAGVSVIGIALNAQLIDRLPVPPGDSVTHVKAILWPPTTQNVRDGLKGTVEFNWRTPQKAEIKEAIDRLHEFLKQPSINEYDINYLGNILQMDDVANALTLDEAVAGLQKMTTPRPTRDAIYKVVNRRWPHDPKIVAYLREAIERREGTLVGQELEKQDAVWDDALIEPLVVAVEKPLVALGSGAWLRALDAHPDGWKGNVQITRRLGDAVAAGGWPLPPAGKPLTADSANLAGMTRDARYVPRLRPWLDDKTVVVDYARSSSGVRWPTLRSCDLAYTAIVKILGEKDEFADERRRGSERATFDATQKALWEKWDLAIDALKAKIDKK